MMSAGRKPEGGSPIVYTFSINIPFISDTHFQKCLCHVKYTSSLPKCSKLKIPSSYCIQDKPRVSVSGAVFSKKNGSGTCSYVRSCPPHNIQHLLVEREQDHHSKTSHLEKRIIEVSSERSQSCLNGTVPGRAFWRSCIVHSLLPITASEMNGWYGCLVWKLTTFSSQLPANVNLGSRKRSKG